MREWIVDLSVAYGGGIVLGAGFGLPLGIVVRQESALTAAIVVAFCLVLLYRRRRRR